MAALIKAIRGMKDILPPETSRWQWVEKVAREVFELYGYAEIRLPLLERTDLFARSIGADTDIVSKEMYTFSIHHEESLTLRPEATAQVVRACLERGLLKTAEVKKFYLMGPMFRYERPQKGRYRQFHQINCEALGSNAPELDAEVILMLLDFLGRLGLKDLKLLVNSLGCRLCTRDFKAQLQLFLTSREGWCDDCRRRRVTNPLRVLDCKSKNCQELLAEAPVMEDSLCEACAAHYRRVLSLLDGAGVAYEKNPRLVRGLDYYTRTAFEVKVTGLGAQDAVAGGGRYNGLARELGGPDLPALGFAIGEERLLEILKSDKKIKNKLVFVAYRGEEAKEKAFSILLNLREKKIASEMNFDDRTLKSQLKIADRNGATFVIIIGDDEIIEGKASIRKMRYFNYKDEMSIDLIPVQSGRMMVEQKKVAFNNIIDYLNNEFKEIDNINLDWE